MPEREVGGLQGDGSEGNGVWWQDTTVRPFSVKAAYLRSSAGNRRQGCRTAEQRCLEGGGGRREMGQRGTGSGGG